ncbi:MAG: hypothetical protein ACYDHG_16390 [Desulfomonilaceae bacterium]
MPKIIPVLIAFLILFSQWPVHAQQTVTLPDVSKMKLLTTQWSSHASDIPGKQTRMDFYSTPEGQIITVYSYKNRSIAFSVHSNSDVQKSYRLFIDPTGNHVFQEINPGLHWEIPNWAR